MAQSWELEMTLREIIRLALGIGSPYANREPDEEQFAPPPAPPSREEVDALHARATQGDRDAQRELGILFYRGRGVETDRAEAFKWLTFAVRQGDLKAEKFFEMVGPTLSTDEAYEGRRRVAEVTGEPLPPKESTWEAGDGFAVRLGDEMFANVPPEPLPVAAAETSAEVREPEAPDRPYGLGPEGKPELEPVSIGGRGWAVALLACVLIAAIAVVAYRYFVRDAGNKGVYVTQGSSRLAAPLAPAEVAELKKVAATGNVEAQLKLARGYETGGGIGTNLAEATTFYQQAAAAGNAEAQFALGVMYEQGRGLAQSYAQAAAWYRRAAEQGFSPAQNNLGVLYIKGLGVKADYVEAYQWIYLAAEGGFRRAANNRDQLTLFMKADEIARAVKQAGLLREKFTLKR